MKITQDTTLSEILNISGAEKVLAKYSLPCLTCPHAQMEMNSLKIGEITKMYNLDLKRILKELNQLSRVEKKK